MRTTWLDVWGPMLIAFAMLMLVATLFGCAHATPVTVAGTWPLYNAAPGSCSPAAGDTCKDLASASFWAQQQGRTDSTLVYSMNIPPGSQGLPFSVTFNLTDGFWNIWSRVRDLANNSSCWSNVVTRVIFTSPAAPTLR